MSISLEDDPSNGSVMVHFSLPLADHPDPVSVVGSFNEWTPGHDLLIDHGDGTIGVSVAVGWGSEVRFRYLGSDGRWFDEPDADEITEHDSVLRIPTGSADADSGTASGIPGRTVAPSAGAESVDTVAASPLERIRKLGYLPERTVVDDIPS